MIIIANELLKNYIAFEDGKWIHDPNMPETLVPEFEQFVKDYNASKERNAKKEWGGKGL